MLIKKSAIKIVDLALGGLFLAVHGLYGLRTTLQGKALDPPDSLMAEWIEARENQAVLHLELTHPTASQLYGSQVKLASRAKAAGDYCYRLVVAMRAARKALEDDSRP